MVAVNIYYVTVRFEVSRNSQQPRKPVVIQRDPSFDGRLQRVRPHVFASNIRNHLLLAVVCSLVTTVSDVVAVGFSRRSEQSDAAIGQPLPRLTTLYVNRENKSIHDSTTNRYTQYPQTSLLSVSSQLREFSQPLRSILLTKESLLGCEQDSFRLKRHLYACSARDVLLFAPTALIGIAIRQRFADYTRLFVRRRWSHQSTLDRIKHIFSPIISRLLTDFAMQSHFHRYRVKP